MEDLDYSAPSIGPRQTLTIVEVAAQSFRASRGGKVNLVTRFELPNGQTVERGWKVAPEPPRWTAAFALPAPPKKAITAVVP